MDNGLENTGLQLSLIHIQMCIRDSPKVLNLPFFDNIRRPDRDNTIDVYISDDYEDVLADGVWEMCIRDRFCVICTRNSRIGFFKGIFYGACVGFCPAYYRCCLLYTSRCV